MDNSNLVDVLLPDKSQQQELEIFLFKYFSCSSGGFLNTRVYGRNGNRTIEVSYNKKKVIKNIKLIDDGVNDSFLTDFLEKAKEALSRENGLKVSNGPLFSSRPVKGFFRYKDFQILPIPEGWPTIQESIRGPYMKYPFILEWKTHKSNNRSIDNYRTNKRAYEITLLLNTLLKSRISIPVGTNTNDWALVQIDDNTVETRLVRPGYYIICAKDKDNRSRDDSGFISSDLFEKIEELPFQQYCNEYSQSKLNQELKLNLPDNLTELLDTYEALPNNKKARFLRASHWKMASHQVGLFSQSMSISALFTAVESLISEPKLDEMYGLKLMSCDSSSSIPLQGESLIIAAKIDEHYHVRIFNMDGEIIFNQARDRVSFGKEIVELLDRTLDNPEDFYMRNKRNIISELIRCGQCKKLLKPGPTDLFRGFIEKYASSRYPIHEKEELYRLRSAFSHGDKLADFDLHGQLISNPEESKFSTNYRGMLEVVQSSLVSWLQEQANK